jgi:cysteine-rich repeat protein
LARRKALWAEGVASIARSRLCVADVGSAQGGASKVLRPEGRVGVGGSSLRCFVSALLVLASSVASAGSAATIHVPADQPTVQDGLNVAQPGDTVLVAPGVYFEKVSFPRSGASGAPIVLKAATDPRGPSPVVLDGSGVAGQNLILIDSKSHVRVEGFVLRNNRTSTEASGIRVLGSGMGIEIAGNVIHEIRGKNAMGITVYGTETTPISDLLIENNEIFDCDPRPSEALTLNGNVANFTVRGNFVHDVNNIGMDFIGGESDIQPDPNLVARNGLVQNNRVARAREGGPTGNGFAACIYVDGGRQIVIERNVVSECDLGIEIGAENAGVVATGNVIRNNFIFANRTACIGFGGYSATVGRANGNFFFNNTCYGNDRAGGGFGELWIQYAENNVVKNNLFAGTQNVLLASWGGNINNTLDYNLWHAPAGSAAAQFVWNGTIYAGFSAYRSATGQDAASLFADPALVDPADGDLHLSGGSPAVNAGDPAFTAAPGETDIDGQPRINGGRVDVGADETASCGNGIAESGFGEECDDGNTIDCDGCDSNCTLSARCGNGILCSTHGEVCDDGNTNAGDCCDASCQFEPASSPCDDGAACTAGACDGSGHCVGIPAPASGCKHVTLPARARILLRDASRDALDRAFFAWQRGEQTLPGELGNPATGATGYELCLYDSSGPTLLFSARVSPGGRCRGKPCWKPLRNGAYRYTNPERTPDGIASLQLWPGAQGKARVIVNGRGDLLQLPALPLPASSSVLAQVRSTDGSCWEATFTAPPRRNDSGWFVDTGQ